MRTSRASSSLLIVLTLLPFGCGTSGNQGSGGSGGTDGGGPRNGDGSSAGGSGGVSGGIGGGSAAGAGDAGTTGTGGTGGNPYSNPDGGVIMCMPGVAGTGITACGYPYSGTPLTGTVFNEVEVLRAIQPAGAIPMAIVRLFYNDEHALTLGVRNVTVKDTS